MQLIVAPLFRLISKAGAQLSDIGPPERAIEKVGNYVTGTDHGARDIAKDLVAQDPLIICFEIDTTQSQLILYHAPTIHRLVPGSRGRCDQRDLQDSLGWAHLLHL